jgi:hypothetical protein
LLDFKARYRIVLDADFRYASNDYFEADIVSSRIGLRQSALEVRLVSHEPLARRTNVNGELEWLSKGLN